MTHAHVFVGEMSSAEVEQCVVDIKGWFIRMDRGKQKGGDGGASTADLEKLQKTIDSEIPKVLECLLREDNSSIYIFDKKLLSCDAIADMSAVMERSSGWKAGMTPFCGDDASALVVDKRNRVYEWDSDEGVGDEVHASMTDYIEDYRNALLAGNFEFISGVGAVEKRSRK
jgi:hypothetical protein